MSAFLHSKLFLSVYRICIAKWLLILLRKTSVKVSRPSTFVTLIQDFLVSILSLIVSVFYIQVIGEDMNGKDSFISIMLFLFCKKTVLYGVANGLQEIVLQGLMKKIFGNGKREVDSK